MEKIDLSNITEAQIEAIAFLERFTRSGTWKINKKTGLVDITGNFIIPSTYAIKDFSGIRFGKVTGDFNCSYNKLTNLEGAPQEVGGDFYCSNNQLKSLVGAPQVVKGDFSCSNNKLKSLVGAPQEVKGSFHCGNNKITSLEGAPQKVGRHFYCSNNQLTSLVGAPQEVGCTFKCSCNKLTNLEGAPQEVGGDFCCNNNRLTSLVGSPQVVGRDFDCSYNKLTNLQGIHKVGASVDFKYNAVGKKTLSLVYETMREKKVEFWEALCMLKDDINEDSWNKIIVGFEDKVTPEAIRTYSIVSRYRNRFFN
jgi:hypothetical protein